LIMRSGPVRRWGQKRAPKIHQVLISSHLVGRGLPTFIVAEIGINHNGSLEIAKELIDAAAEAGCQAVKFQKRTVPVVYSEADLAKPRAVDRSVLENAIKRGVLSPKAVQRLQQSDFQNSTNGDLKWALEFTAPEYRELFAYSKTKNLFCFASPWDEAGVDFLEQLNPPCYKVASAMIAHERLLQKIAATGRPVIVSTGMSTMDEVKTALRFFDKSKLILLHTVSTYPTIEHELNLGLILKLKQEFAGVPVGYSGHEPGIVFSVAAAALGAHLIERHLTLDKKMFGTDQAASLEPVELKEMVTLIRKLSAGWGDGSKRVLESELPIQHKLRIVSKV